MAEATREERWDKLRELLKESPHDDIHPEFLVWAVEKGESLSDPLKDDFTMHAAWAAWREGRRNLTRSEYTARVADWVQSDCIGPAPQRPGA